MRADSQQPQVVGRKRALLRMLLLTLVLGTVWLLWSGLFKPLLIGLGLFSCLLTVYVLHRMQFFRDDTLALRYGPGLLFFLAWLIKEVVLSCLEVAKVVLAPKIRMSPRVLSLDVAHLGPVDQVLLGNSITLTPGTLTMDLHQGRITVHALTRAGADALEAGEMQRRVSALRGG